MKRFVMLLTIPVAFAALALAESWKGTLMDVMCKDKDPASHTRQCAIACSKSGYGIVLSGGTFLKFDDEGNAKALEALKASRKNKDLKATVTGTLAGEVIHVESVALD